MDTRNSHNWPLWWRICMLLNVGLYNLLGNALASGIAPLFPLLIADLHCTLAEVGHLSSYTLLALGLSNILALPCSALIGKRYLVRLSQLIFIACNVWAAESSSYNSLLAALLVGGLSAGVIEALGPTFVVETFAEKQLSRAMVVYMGFLASGAALGPFSSGLISTHLKSWRWFFWIEAIVTGCVFLGSLLMLPETTDEFTLEYDPSARPDILQTPSDDKTRQDENGTTLEEIETAAEDPDQPNWYRVWRENSLYVPDPRLNVHRAFRAASKSILLICMPPVTLTILVYGVSIGWFVVARIITAAVFQSPPYLWDSQSIGFFGISTFVGIVLGVPFGGNLSDYLSRRSARRNQGIHHPESRLPALIIPFIVSPLGLIIIGIYLARGEIWIRQAIGTAMLSFGATSAGTTMVSYAVDSFPHRSGEIGVLVNVVKNTLGFGLSYVAVSWWQAEGFLSQFGTMAGVLWVVYLLVVPLYFFGPHVRLWATKKLKM